MTLQSHEIPTVVMVGSINDEENDVSTSVIYTTTSSGTERVFIDFSLYDINFSDLIDTLLEVDIVDLNDSFTDVYDELRTNLLKYIDRDILVTFWIALKNGTTDDVEVEWFLTGPLQRAINDTEVSFRINIGTIPAYYDTDVDIGISGVTYHNCSVDAYCSNMVVSSGIDVDIRHGLGRLTRLETDLYSSALKTEHLSADIYNSILSTSSGIVSDLVTTSGTFTSYETDIFSTVLTISGTTEVDFKTRSLFTGDFFIDTDTFTTASSIAWVDVVDYLYPIDTDNTYLSVNDVTASGVYFENIPDGKRMYYDPVDDFYSDGVLTYSIHAESTIGEVEEKDFYLLYGYDLQLNEVIDWGPNKRIVVRAEAQNLSFCPNLASEAFDFTTADLASVNLGMTINPVGFVDLNVQILPQSTVFFYGQTYTVKLKNVKDFAGNIMQELEYTFTIEDP